MREITAWLLHDDQNDLFEIVTAILLNVLFLALTAFILPIFGQGVMVWHLAKGFGVLWLATFVTAVVLGRIQQYFRVDLYDHPNAYLVSNLFVSVILQTGWAAFVAVTLHSFVDDAPGWRIAGLYLIGTVSCIIAFYIVSSFYQGHFYRFISFPLALISFILFGIWPASGRMLYGWFFDLF